MSIRIKSSTLSDFLINKINLKYHYFRLRTWWVFWGSVLWALATCRWCHLSTPWPGRACHVRADAMFVRPFAGAAWVYARWPGTWVYGGGASARSASTARWRSIWWRRWPEVWRHGCRWRRAGARPPRSNGTGPPLPPSTPVVPAPCLRFLAPLDI